MGTSEFNTGGIPSRETLCNRNCDKLWSDGPLDLYADLTLHYYYLFIIIIYASKQDDSFTLSICLNLKVLYTVFVCDKGLIKEWKEQYFFYAIAGLYGNSVDN